MATKNFYVIRRNSSVLVVLSIPEAESILLRVCFDFDDSGLKFFWQFPFMPFRSLLEIH